MKKEELKKEQLVKVTGGQGEEETNNPDPNNPEIRCPGAVVQTKDGQIRDYDL